MFETTLLIGLVLLVILMVINMILSKVTSSDKYVVYMPAVIIAGTGLILLFISAFNNISITGLGLGGWGIACMFAAAITCIVTSIVDVNTNA